MSLLTLAELKLAKLHNFLSCSGKMVKKILNFFIRSTHVRVFCLPWSIFFPENNRNCNDWVTKWVVLKFLENTFTILVEVEEGVRTFLHRSPDATNRASVQFLAKSPKPLDPTCHEKNVERENVDASKRWTSFRHVGVWFETLSRF